MTTPPELTVDAATLGNYLGIGDRQLANYRKMGLPMQGRNTYAVASVIEWYVNWKVQAALKTNQKPIQADEEELKLRKLEAEALSKEIEVEQLRGGLVRIEDAQKELGKHLTSVRNGIVSFPARTAPFLVAVDNERKVRDILDREVTALMSYLQEMADSPDVPVSDDTEDVYEEESEE